MRPDGGPPIAPYCRVPIIVRDSDPRAVDAAARLIEMIAKKRPGARAEHVGSSAVPGLAGKGTIDLLLPTAPEEIPAVTRDLQGVIRHDGTSFRVHVHVVPDTSPELASMRGFRDALLADPALREEYAALKRAIVAGGTVDSVAFTRAKHDYIVAVLRRLGLPHEGADPQA
jgi:GrpB-like predicted nucleotidyltransferase (UPF0157 family)